MSIEPAAGPASLLARTRERVSAHPQRWAALVLVVLLTATSAATLGASRVARKDERRQAERDAGAVVQTIDRRLLAYGEVLVAARGLFEVERHPSRSLFRRFVDSLQVEARYPGVRVISFARAIDRAELPAYEQNLRREAGAAGYSRFAVHPSGRRGGYLIIDRIEPLAGNEAALGFDLLSEGARARAVHSTKLTGGLAATAPVRLVQQGAGGKGFLFVLAVRNVGGALTSARTGRLEGVVTAAFEYDDLLRQILGRRMHDFDLEVYDVGSIAARHPARPSRANLLFDNDRRSGGDGGPGTVRRSLAVGGRRWAVHYRALGAAGASRTSAVWIIGIGGGLGSVLAAWLFLTLARGRSLAIALARQMTHDLEHSEAELARSNAELRSAEQQYRAVVDSALDAIVSADRSGCITYFSPGAERIFGYGMPEIIGKPLTTLMPARFHDAHTAGLNRFLATGESRILGRTVEVAGRRKDGSEFPLEAALACWRSGAEVGFTGVLRDVTVRRESEDRMQRSQKMLGDLLNSAPDAVVIADSSGRITLVNEQTEQLFGYGRAELLGLPVETLLPRRFHARHAGHRAGYVAAPRTRPMGVGLDLAGRRKDGSEFPVDISLSSVETDAGRLVTAFIRDITERKRTQDELAAAHEHAVAASRLKSDFVANMSHEIRTPLNGVIGMSGLLLDTDLDEEQREYAMAALSSADALMSVIDDILDFSKIEAGKLELDRDEFGLREIVDGVAALVAPTADHKAIEMMTWVAQDLPEGLYGDGPRIRQVLTNLMTNAVKFTHKGEIIVRVSGEPASGDRLRLRFEVADTGIGIEPAALDRIFDSFSQADTSTTRRYGGTGLGLAISRQLVALMGGEIEVLSTPGRGTTFTFTVPVELARSGTFAGDELALTGVRVLVVDDNATNRAILERQLAAWGTTCRTVAHAQGALRELDEARAAGTPYDIVLLDHDMPDISGLELTKAIRATPGLHDTRLVLLVSSGIGRADATAAGIDGFLTKPVGHARLRDEVGRSQAAKDGDAAAERSAAPAAGTRRTPAGRPVLVAEDHGVNQLVAVRLLEQRGCRVDVAANGREAVDKWASGDYELIFMDCQMPELDGYVATAEIRRREDGRRRTPIIAMTANTLQGDREKCLAAGMDDYIGKPLRPARLDDVLARARHGEYEAPADDAQDGGDPDASDTGAEPPVLDRSLIDAVCGDNRDARERLVRMFLDRSRTTIAELGTAISGDDPTRVHRLAHGLKGSADALGAVRLAQISGRLCEESRAGRLAGAHQLLAELEAALELTALALSEVGSASAGLGA